MTPESTALTYPRPVLRRLFCPRHFGEQRRCNQFCTKRRLEFAEAARDLNDFWRKWDRPVRGGG